MLNVSTNETETVSGSREEVFGVYVTSGITLSAIDLNRPLRGCDMDVEGATGTCVIPPPTSVRLIYQKCFRDPKTRWCDDALFGSGDIAIPL